MTRNGAWFYAEFCFGSHLHFHICSEFVVWVFTISTVWLLLLACHHIPWTSIQLIFHFLKDLLVLLQNPKEWWGEVSWRWFHIEQRFLVKPELTIERRITKDQLANQPRRSDCIFCLIKRSSFYYVNYEDDKLNQLTMFMFLGGKKTKKLEKEKQLQMI